MPSQAEPHSR